MTQTPRRMARATSIAISMGMAAAAVLAGLGDETPDSHGTVPVETASAVPGESRSAPTFSGSIAPIVYEHCASCHRPGEAAPFSLLTYQDVQKRARQIVEVTGARYMPPWHAEDGGVPLAHKRRLTDAQIELFKQWMADGTPEGDREKLSPPPKFPEGWQLGEPDLVLKMPEPFQVPAEGKDIYRNFVLPLDLPSDKWVRAVEFRPQARTVVHHCLFFLDSTGRSRQLDAADPAPGFKGMSGGRQQDLLPMGGWAVGGNPRSLPDGLAWRVPKGADLILQMHFHLSGKVESEQSMIGLFFADQAPERSFAGIQLPPVFGALAGIDIPAGTNRYVVRDSFVLPVDVDAFAVGGHAHYLARQMHLTATPPGGAGQTLLKINDWDFAWQEQYTFQERVRLPKGTRLESEITYDNSAENPRNPTHPPRRVKWGRMSTDEMGCLTLQVTAVDEEQMPQLRSALKSHLRQAFLGRISSRLGAGPRAGPDQNAEGSEDIRSGDQPP